MKLHAKHFSIFFGVLTVLLLGIGSATIAYRYCQMQYAILYEGASAPAGVVFFSAIPFLLTIAITLFLTFMFYKKHKQA
jgi:uncharacterized membrane protein